MVYHIPWSISRGSNAASCALKEVATAFLFLALTDLNITYHSHSLYVVSDPPEGKEKKVLSLQAVRQTHLSLELFKISHWVLILVMCPRILILFRQVLPSMLWGGVSFFVCFFILRSDKSLTVCFMFATLLSLATFMQKWICKHWWKSFTTLWAWLTSELFFACNLKSSKSSSCKVKLDTWLFWLPWGLFHFVTCCHLLLVCGARTLFWFFSPPPRGPGTLLWVNGTYLPNPLGQRSLAVLEECMLIEGMYLI